jgi:type I restriction enzyme M protein
MTENEFLKELEKKLWTSANKLLPSLDAAVYKHVMLGLVFLKYVSDAFTLRRKELADNFADPNSDDYFGDDPDLLTEELEIRDNYLETNVFWVPVEARWQGLEQSAKLSMGAKLPWDAEFKGVGRMLDDAMTAIERENPRLKGILNKDYARLQVEDARLGDLINLVSQIPFTLQDMDSKDILGHVYEYFLGQFALAEGRRGGQFYTPKSIVSLMVEMLQPFKGRVYDPAMGSGGFFVSSERFIEEHKGRLGNISVYGQESNPTTWRLAAMNMVIRGIDFNFGGEPADTLRRDLHPDLRADYVMANPPFNMKEWGGPELDGDKRWKEFGQPPANNANFAWLLHMYFHLAPQGAMGLLLSNGSMSSSTGGEGDIRQKLIETDAVECLVALPGQLFTNTQIPACIWFLAKDKKRKGEVLLIDARERGYMKDRVLRDFKSSDIQDITDTFHQWRQADGYEDTPGFCKSADIDLIAKHEFILTPGRYVGAVDVEDDGEPFEEKMARLTADLKDQFKDGEKIEAQIRTNLRELGYEL